MEGLDTLLKRFGKQEAPINGMKAADGSTGWTGTPAKPGRPDIVQHSDIQTAVSNTV